RSEERTGRERRERPAAHHGARGREGARLRGRASRERAPGEEDREEPRFVAEDASERERRAAEPRPARARVWRGEQEIERDEAERPRDALRHRPRPREAL